MKTLGSVFEPRLGLWTVNTSVFEGAVKRETDWLKTCAWAVCSDGVNGIDYRAVNEWKWENLLSFKRSLSETGLNARTFDQSSASWQPFLIGVSCYLLARLAAALSICWANLIEIPAKIYEVVSDTLSLLDNPARHESG